MGSCIGQDFYLFSVPASKRTGNRLKSQFFKLHPATVRAVFVYYSPRENLFCGNSLTEASHKNRTQLSSLLRQVTFERSGMTHQGTLCVCPSEWKKYSLQFEFNRENGTKANVVNFSWVNCLRLKFFIFHYHYEILTKTERKKWKKTQNILLDACYVFLCLYSETVPRNRCRPRWTTFSSICIILHT